MLKRKISTPISFMQEKETSPLDNVASLVDLMLVLACGLMMAIVSFWDIDLSRVNEANQDAYENIGSVYEDPDTGKIYIIEDGE